jgi:hypothetical protein
MAEEDETEETGTEETENEEKEEESTEEEDDSEEGSEEKAKKDPELEKAIRRRDRALAENRRLKKALEEGAKKDDDKDDPVATANAKVIRSAARAVLAGAGITDKDDQAEVLSVINLSDISVNEDGDPDEDEIEDRIERLRGIFSTEPKRNSRVPRTVKTKRETTETNTDPDKSRYRRIGGWR